MRSLLALSVALLLSGCVAPAPAETADLAETDDLAEASETPSAEPTYALPSFRPTPTPEPTGSTCDGSAALEWRRALLEDYADREALRITGTDAGQRVDFELHLDLLRKELHMVDHASGETLLLTGDMGYWTDAEGTYGFPDVGQGWFRWILDDDGSEETLFTTRAGLFLVECTHGDTRFQLTYEGGGVEEQWRFSEAGELEFATFADTFQDSSVRLTQLAPVIPDPPADPARAPGLFTYEVLYDEVDDDGVWAMGLRVGAGQNGRHLSDLTLDAFAGEAFVEELSLQAGPRLGDSIGYDYTDLGTRGVLDEGDLLDIVVDLHMADSWYLYDSWSDAYFEEEVLDGTNGMEHLPWEGTDDVQVEQTYTWSFGGNGYVLSVWIPQALQEEYEKRSRAQIYSSTHGGYVPDYQAYVYDALDDETLTTIAEEIRRIGHENGFTDDEVVSMVLAFVQSLEYTSDSVTSPYDEYPRYPIETLLARGGDCEDTSILFASLVQVLGYDVVMLAPPGHMAVGVYGDEGLVGTYYEHEGRRYYFAETTGSGRIIGEVPSAYADAQVQIYEVSGARPTLVIDDWTIDAGTNGYTDDVWFQFSNTGATDSRRGTATVYAIDAESRIVDQDECDFDVLEASFVYECNLVLANDDRIVDHVFEVSTVDGLRAIEYASEYGA